MKPRTLYLCLIFKPLIQIIKSIFTNKENKIKKKKNNKIKNKKLKINK